MLKIVIIVYSELLLIWFSTGLITYKLQKID
jgi:hypothetical protein